jgi:hypothetical protein
MVTNTSKGPCCTFLSSRIANAAATPIPLSAPKVVPFAVTQSPSIYAGMPSLEKSNTG